MQHELKKLKKPLAKRGPVVTIIMDGAGKGRQNESNAWYLANTPVLDSLQKNHLYTELFAHGTYVGLPDDTDMGNSEVGHNAIGAGKVYPQGAKLVNLSITSGGMFKGKIWNELNTNVLNNNSCLHFIGLLSDGNVHSHINHLKEMIRESNKLGVKNIAIHALLDGRDVGETSAPVYINDTESFLAQFNSNLCNYRIASVGGRMTVTMDRYMADWKMVERGWALHVEGKGRQFKSAIEGYETIRQETSKTDQFFEPYVIASNGKPLGRMQDGDSVIFFNFRGDRSIEISRAFDEPKLNTISREYIPKVMYAGMMEYDGDLHIPRRYLVNPPAITNTMGEYLAKNDICQFALSETQKFGHVTYFWNGNRSGKFSEEKEKYIEIPSDNIPFEQRPWMQCALITDTCIDLLKSGKYQFGRINFPNGDMVGHSGVMNAARIAMESVDICIGRLITAVKKINGIAVITADHGNCDEMYEWDKKNNCIQTDKKTGLPVVKTSHTLNKVPFIIYDPSFKGEYGLSGVHDGGLSNIAATVLNLLGYEAPEDYDKSLITFKE